MADQRNEVQEAMSLVDSYVEAWAARGAPVEDAARAALETFLRSRLQAAQQAEPCLATARVLAEFVRTAPGRLPQRVQDALAVVEATPAQPSAPAQWFLFEHSDGRRAVAQPGAAFLAGDPSWYRAGPVELHGVPSTVGAPSSEVEVLRAQQTLDVMPMIGPLLDSWDGVPNDTKGVIGEDAPDLVKALGEISRAMDGNVRSEALSTTLASAQPSTQESPVELAVFDDLGAYTACVIETSVAPTEGAWAARRIATRKLYAAIHALSTATAAQAQPPEVPGGLKCDVCSDGFVLGPRAW